MTPLSNGGLPEQIAAFVQRVENVDAEMDALRQDRTDLIKDFVSTTGLSKAAIANIITERKKDPRLVHIVHTDMAAIRRATSMPEPLDPPAEAESGAEGGWQKAGDHLDGSEI